MLLFAPGVCSKSKGEVLDQPSEETLISPSVFDMALLTCSSAEDVPLLLPLEVGQFIETIENTAGGGSNHIVSTWTKKDSR
jgi:hypothetical protein